MSKPFSKHVGASPAIFLLVLLGMISGAWAYHIGDYVWLDTDRDGLQDSDETGVAGVVVNVYRCADNLLIGTATTDSIGWYEVMMGYSTPEPFYVQFVLPAGSTYLFTMADQGIDDTRDSDPDQNGFTACFTWPLPYYPDPGYLVEILDFDAGLVEGEVPPCAGTATPGYWKNHPDAWPVEEIVIGGITYSKASAINWLRKPVKQDKTLNLFAALVSAKLNVINGTEDSCIADTILTADAWMAAHPVGSGVKANSKAWKQISDEFTDLDDYNNGLLCAPKRDS